MLAGRTRIALIAIACVAFGVRVTFLLGDGGALASPTDYDDGVYFAASALLARGVLPYRDFVFVHPPGIAWFYAWIAWWRDPAIGFAAARFVACVLGAGSTFLVGRIVARSGSAVAAVLAAALYALYPDAVTVEHSTFLEPLLNVACLGAALLWLREEERPARAGVLAGVAGAVKLLGGIWVIAALATPRRGMVRFLLAGMGTGVVLLAPLVVVAPAQFFEQVIRFQLIRPPDGTLGAAARLPLILGAQPAAALFAAIGLVALLVKRSRELRFFAIATLLTIAAFVASSSYWTQYNSYLAASECVLAGFGIAFVVQWRKAFAWLATAIVGVLLVAPARQIVDASRARSSEAIALRHARIDPATPLFAFDPSWGLVAGHLPPHGDGAPVIVDSYGAMLLEATRNGRYCDTNAAFAAAHEQRAVRARLEHTPLLIAGWRGNWQLPPADRAWVRANFLCITPEASELCVQERVARPFDGIVRADGNVTFGEGWWSEEGSGAEAWRWMGARGTIVLPPLQGPARLHLELQIPEGQPSIVITLDGHIVDRIHASGTIVRSYPITGTGRAATLVLTTSKTFVPSSADTRALGLMLRRLVLTPVRDTDAGAALSDALPPARAASPRGRQTPRPGR